MKKILILSLLISCSQFFMSCENWFDVNPKSQVKNDILLENENGYKTALFGIYTTMATPALYGQELTMSLLDVLAQYYTINDNYHNFYNASIYNYEASTVKSKFDAIGKTMYKTIMNCNNLLENMEGRQELFSGHNYELIRGETLGLRAYLHFDLLRMFAPSFTVGANAAAIPYVDRVTRTPFPQLTNMAVTEKILQDCEEALSLLEVSDPFGPAADNTEPEDEFLRNREERMNYYAVKALMARVYLWAGQTPKAGNIANELIAHPLLGTNRILFRLYSDKITTMSDDYFTVNSENNLQLSLSQNQRKEFYETEKRLNEINHLKTKYGNSYEKIMDYCKKQEERIEILENYDAYMQELKASCEQLEQDYLKRAQKLSTLRKKKANMLEKKIQKGLEDLNFEQVQFEIHFAEKKEYSKDGIDDAEFRISLNQGQQVKPLTEVASGGELSRIMLAIKAVMADKDEIETLIFDEIDVGISGRTAQKVSEKMALIGKEHQVICITHLAQIAAMADQHFLIEKKTEDAVTRTHIYPLTEEKSVEELARILGGAKITDTVIQSAKEMKNLAGQIK